MYQNEIECYIFVVDCLLTSSEVWKITVFKAFFFVFTICKHLFFGRSIWPLQRAYVMANLNTGQAFLKSSNTLGFRGVAQACWSIETLDRSAHYLDFRNRKSALLCYYQTATNFFHSVQNARNFIWPYCWVLKSRWCQCLRGYESYWD